MKREDLRKILRGKCVTDEACEAAIDELLKAKLPEQVDLFEAFTAGADSMFNTEIAPRITVREKFGEWIEQFKKERE